MVTQPLHERVASICKRNHVSVSILLEELLAMVDETALSDRLTEIRALDRDRRINRHARNNGVRKIADTLTAAEIAALQHPDTLLKLKKLLNGKEL